MKKVILFAFSLFILFSQTLIAQDEDLKKGDAALTKVDSLYTLFFKKDSMSALGITQQAILNKTLGYWKEAEEAYIKAVAIKSDYAPGVKYVQAYYNSSFAEFHENLKEYESAASYIDKAFTYRPSLNSPSKYDVNKFWPLTQDDWNYDFLYQIYLGTRIHYKLKNYDKVLELLKVMEASIAPANYYNAFSVYHEGARVADQFSKDDLEMEYRIKTLEYFPKMEQDLKERNEKLIPEIITNIKENNAVKDAEWYARSAKAISQYEKYADANQQYKKYSTSTSPTLQNGWDYSETAMKEPDKEDAKNAIKIIEKYTSGFSEYEWERLQKVYEFIGDNAKVQEINNKIIEARRKAEEERRLKAQRDEQERKLQAQRDEEERKRREKANRKANARGNFSVAVSTNPFMYIWKDYPIALDIRIGRIVSEFRVNLSNTTDKGDKYRFGQYKLGSNSNSNPYPYHYKGMEYSYSLKILAGNMDTKNVGRRKQITSAFVGFQPRYAKYNFRSEPYTFTDSTTMVPQTFNNISASATRYEFCILGGFIGDNLGGFFHIDYYFGVGIGYRQLDIAASLPDGSADPTFKYENYAFGDNGDKRFDPDRWNKFYVPVRFGFRIGINLF